MKWTKEKIGRIPDVYLDFMRVLRPVVESQSPDAVPKVKAVPLGSIFTALARYYQYTPLHVRELAENLKKAGLVKEDRLRYVSPTVKGVELIEELIKREEPVPCTVPPLPEL